MARPSRNGFLLTSVPDPSRRIGRLKPDILIYDLDHQPLLVIDAKYKRLADRLDRPNGVARDDLYQLAAYLGGHEVGLGALAYPPQDSDEATAEELAPWIMSSGKRMTFLRLPAEAGACVIAMKELAGTAISQDERRISATT